MTDACCAAMPNGSAETGTCPICGNRGKSVSKFTVSVFVKDTNIYMHPERLAEGRYFICETRSCSTVYFNGESHTMYSTNDVRGKVWQKEESYHVPACYCFHHTVSSIADELKQNGTTNVLSRISSEVKAGNCRCEVTNPQGSCCLGNVAMAIRRAKAILDAGGGKRPHIVSLA